MNTAIAITAIICAVVVINIITYAIRDTRLAKHKAIRPYPRDDGDVTVLGPETFVSKDDTVISWKGANYVRQEVERKAP